MCAGETDSALGDKQPSPPALARAAPNAPAPLAACQARAIFIRPIKATAGPAAPAFISTRSAGKVSRSPGAASVSPWNQVRLSQLMAWGGGGGAPWKLPPSPAGLNALLGELLLLGPRTGPEVPARPPRGSSSRRVSQPSTAVQPSVVVTYETDPLKQLLLLPSTALMW